MTEFRRNTSELKTSLIGNRQSRSFMARFEKKNEKKNRRKTCAVVAVGARQLQIVEPAIVTPSVKSCQLKLRLRTALKCNIHFWP